MRYAFIILLVLTTLGLSANAEWHGFCVVERDNLRICSAYYPRTNDFSTICNTFALEEQAYAWRAQFFSNLDLLRMSIPDHCDEVRDNSENTFFACLAESYCSNDPEPARRHLASRVYAQNDQKAIADCFKKEESRYERELKEQSKKACFMRISVEPSIN